MNAALPEPPAQPRAAEDIDLPAAGLAHELSNIRKKPILKAILRIGDICV